MSDLIPLVLDFESHYDKDYSLTKMPTMQYVRDPRFEALGCAVKLPGQPSVWLTPERLAPFFDGLPWGRIMLVCHNTQVDGAVLNERFGHRPARYACTMFMLRYLVAQGHLDPEQTTSAKAAAPLVGMEKGDLDQSLADGTLGTYATGDADICAALFEKYWHLLPQVERDYIHIHVQAAAEPAFDIDRPRLQALADADRAMEAMFPIVRKDDKFAALLDKLGVSPEWKTTDKGTYKLATSKKDSFMARLHEHPDERVRKLAEVRAKASSTIERTRSQRFLDVGAPLPAPLLYFGAHTARSSGLDKLNVQNLKKDGDLRRCIKAPEGHSLVIVDSSQIEVRVNAWLSGQEDLLEEFRGGADPYLSFAGSLYGDSYDTLTAQYEDETARKVKGPAGTKRQVAKAAVLALGFGQGANGFEAYCAGYNIDMTSALAARTVSAYRSRYKRIAAHWKASERELRELGHTPLPNGEKITYPRLRIGPDGLEFQRHAIFRKAKSEGFTSLWHGKIVENKVQRVARDVVFEQSLRLWRAGWRILLMVHDEVCLCVPDDRIDEAVRACEIAFGSTPKWMPRLPVAGEVKVSKEYLK